MNTLKNILAECQRHNLHLCPARGRLAVQPIAKCPAALAAALKANRAKVLAWLCRNRFFRLPRLVQARRRQKFNRRIVFT